MSSKPSAGHVEATVLHAILKRHAKNPHARSQALDAVMSAPNSFNPSSKSRNAAVRLVKWDVDNDTPAIWLHPAEGTIPTMHYYSWCALGRPTPRENRIYVGMNNISRPSHKRGEHCGSCVADAWQNASLCLINDFSKLEVKVQQKKTTITRKVGEQGSAGVRKVLGNLRESFRSQGFNEAAEGSKHPKPAKPAKRQDLTAERVWRS
ncbi:uncharacterized protein M421DRAFT_417781 [Didymella exigua CBS 183.55]|uniref:Uncharacterized protein n=1 Tax=Didymella exigua CBS 183.55 TaxID=1150837 RepID=A0A6A5RVX2_9PLEO|nr:uncharacterized protein M421DRAFT_417781 [Didymella exigua CBS 183.55]KAF1931128.1 hypothetical protein M421DRAFT_417781 [Didymella exigua CBS 183.55]